MLTLLQYLVNAGILGYDSFVRSHIIFHLVVEIVDGIHIVFTIHFHNKPSNEFNTLSIYIISRLTHCCLMLAVFISVLQVGLASLRKSFVEGFVSAFESVRDNLLWVLVGGHCSGQTSAGHETVAQLQRAVKQLTFTPLTDVVARKVLFLVQIYL